jgi:hypothetical protein
MTWLGKILTLVVMLGSVVWAYFTVQSYVTRVNWKTELERERAGRKASDSALVSESRRYQASEESLRRKLDAAEKRAGDYEKQVKDLSDKSADLATKHMDLQTALGKADAKQMERDAKIDRTLKELVTVRERNTIVEKERDNLVLGIEEARRNETKAKNEAKLALAIAEENAKRYEEALAKITELRAIGGGGAGSLLRVIDKPPPPVLANLRGEVTAVSGDLVTLSIGIDAGLAVGTTLDIYRIEGGARYLGTVKVTSALNLFPKQAIVTFTPARNVPIERLRAEELPKKGDEVRPLNALTGGQ